jgi:catechol 2,3-dioxygenase-like lactoylglutathione lyase family enzyme
MLTLLHDPEGKIVEFTRYLPDSLHFEDRGKHLGEHRISRQLIAVGMDVRDLAVEKAFYTSKLGFEEMGVTGLAVKLRWPGDSGEQIELESSKPESKPRIVFETASVSRASEELRQAGFDLNPSAVSVAVSDPDGTFILFVQTDDPPTEGNK